MPLTDYTSYDAVRAVLGVSKTDLSDATLSLDIYLTKLVADLDSISVELNPLYLSLIEPLPDPPPDPLPDPLTPEQQRFVNAVRVFAPYTVGASASSGLAMSGLKRIEDGKAKAERFSGSFEAMTANLSGEYSKWRDNLIAAFTALGYAVLGRPTRVLSAVVAPAYDPITGEGA